MRLLGGDKLMSNYGRRELDWLVVVRWGLIVWLGYGGRCVCLAIGDWISGALGKI